MADVDRPPLIEIQGTPLWTHDVHGVAGHHPLFDPASTGLFVSDGSVMTTGAAANPTLTIVALAIRQAEHIADRLGRGDL